jgi:8-oxo-dGTP diphosphatase
MPRACKRSLSIRNRQSAIENAFMKPQIEVAAAIIFKEEQILISQRDEHSHLSGYWEFPGGRREQLETFEECLQREIREELNVDVEVQNLFEAVEHEYPDKVVSLRFYSCRYLGGEVKALGCRQFRWVLPRELPRYHFPPANLPVLQRLISL